MPHIVEIASAPRRTDQLLARLADIDQVIGLRVQRGVSLRPAGDVVTVTITTGALPRLLQALSSLGIDEDPGSAITTIRPTSVISTQAAEPITRDSSESSWEELEHLLNSESGTTPNSMLTMTVAGFIAALGLATDALHLVIGAVLIAAAFEPIARVALGIATGSAAWRRGASDVGKGYLCLAGGAALAALCLQGLGSVPTQQGSYLPQGILLGYFGAISPVSVLVSIAAGLAGPILVLTMRSVLASGVMISLGLIPATAMSGMGLALRDPSLLSHGLSRLALDMALVLAAAVLVYGWKRRRTQRRRMWM